MCLRRIVFASLLVTCCGVFCLPTARPEEPQKPTPKELVRRLSGPDEAAQAEAVRLLGLLDYEPPELHRAAESLNAGVRERAGQALRAIRQRTADRVMGRADRYAKDGRVDLLAASSAGWTLPAAEERVWLPPTGVARRIAEKADPHVKLTKLPAANFTRFAELYNPDLRCLPAPFREPPIVGRNKFGGCRQVGLVAPGVSTTLEIMDSIVVSRGSVTADMRVGGSVVLATGDVRTLDVRRSIIVCDGDLTVDRDLDQSVVVARGSITVNIATQSTLIASGAIAGKSERFPLLAPRSLNVVRADEANPLGFITFFELAAVGLEVTDKGKEVRVAKLAATSPLRAAGVRPDDTIAKVNDNIVATREELRRGLRDAVATKGEATLSVVRDGTARDVRVVVPD